MLFASKFKFLPTFYNKVRYSNVFWWVLFISELVNISENYYLLSIGNNYGGLRKPLMFFLIVSFLFSCFMLFGPKIKALQGLYKRINEMSIFGFNGVLSLLLLYVSILPILRAVGIESSGKRGS